MNITALIKQLDTRIEQLSSDYPDRWLFSRVGRELVWLDSRNEAQRKTIRDLETTQTALREQQEQVSQTMRSLGVKMTEVICKEQALAVQQTCIRASSRALDEAEREVATLHNNNRNLYDAVDRWRARAFIALTGLIGMTIAEIVTCMIHYHG